MTIHWKDAMRQAAECVQGEGELLFCGINTNFVKN